MTPRNPFTGAPAGWNNTTAQYHYQCPNGHTRTLRNYREQPPPCNTKGCGQRTVYVRNPDKSAT